MSRWAAGGFNFWGYATYIVFTKVGGVSVPRNANSVLFSVLFVIFPPLPPTSRQSRLYPQAPVSLEVRVDERVRRHFRRVTVRKTGSPFQYRGVPALGLVGSLAFVEPFAIFLGGLAGHALKCPDEVEPVAKTAFDSDGFYLELWVQEQLF